MLENVNSSFHERSQGLALELSLIKQVWLYELDLILSAIIQGLPYHWRGENYNTVCSN